VWWNKGIQVIGAGRTAMFLNGMPAMSLLFAVLLLDENLTWMHGLDFLTVFVAVWLGTKQIKSKSEAQVSPARETA
jgi:drug/metabolite transporter (DMT)-like permease